MGIEVEQTSKESERVQTILPIESGKHSHPYCDKTDGHWFRVVTERLGFASGAFEMERDVDVYGYTNENGVVSVEEPLGKTNVFYFIAPQLITFVGVLGDQAYILSRPAGNKDGKLVFPKLQKLREGFFETKGIYFAIRPVLVEDAVMKQLVAYLKSK